MEENKKSKDILIGVLITMVICMGAFIIYDKVLSDKDNDNNNSQLENNNGQINSDNTNDKENNNIQENNGGVININGYLVKGLTDVFINNGYAISSLYNWYDEDYVVSNYIAKGDGFYVKDSIKLADLNLKTKLEFVYLSLGRLEVGQYYTEAQFKTEYEKLFGIDGYGTLDEVYELKYDANTKKYIKTGDVGGDETIHKTFVKVLSARTGTNDKDCIEIDVKVIYGSVMNSKLVTYSEYQRKNQVQEYQNYSYDTLNWNNDDYAVYKFTFVADGKDNYIFDSVVKQK